MIYFSDKASVFSVPSETPFTKLVFFLLPLKRTHINIRDVARVSGVNRM